MFTRLGVFLLWLLHPLPLPLLARLGNILGALLYLFARERRHIAHTNLRLCFPEYSQTQINTLAKRNFRAFGRSFLERSILWWSSATRIQKLISIDGLEHLQHAQQNGQPIILLAPHFVALDVGWSWLTQQMNLVSMYSNQKNPYINKKLRNRRLRFGHSQLYSRQQGLRPIIKAMKQGTPFYYLPDQDQGVKDGMFSPFFGIPTATLTAVPRLAKITGAQIIPFTSRMKTDGSGYQLRFYPAWQHYPSGDLSADTRRMNAFIEQSIDAMPEQYFWLHKRFKTRPPGEAKLY